VLNFLECCFGKKSPVAPELLPDISQLGKNSIFDDPYFFTIFLNLLYYFLKLVNAGLDLINEAFNAFNSFLYPF